MKKTTIYCFLSFLILFGKVFCESKDQCIICHLDVGDKPAALYKTDVHFQMGLSCAACHGGNSTSDDKDLAMNRSKGYIGKPGKNKIVDICFNCHSDSIKMRKYGSLKPVGHIKLYKESVHGTTEITTCITCHGVHNIARVNDPKSPVYPLNEVKLCAKCHSDPNYIKTFNPSLPTDQYEKYKTSMHGQRNAAGDTKVATCSDCHSPHNIFPANDPRARINAFNIPYTCGKCHSDKTYMKSYNIPTNQFEKYSKSVHGIALLVKHDKSAPTCNSCHGNHGAIPVGVKSISHICGTCHALNADMFSKSPHAEVFEKNNIPQCEVCHSNHLIERPDDDMFRMGKESRCIKCHNVQNDKGFMAVLTMTANIDSLLFKQKLAMQVLFQAENMGMDVSESKYEMNEVKQILIKARTVIHKANLNDFKNEIKPGFDIVNRAITAGNEALDEFYFRRWGLGASSLIITFLVVSLYMKLKKIEKKQKNSEK